MTFLRSLWAEFIGLFVDDGMLALQSLALVLVVAGLVKGLGFAPLAGGVLLLVGCLAFLALSLRRQQRRKNFVTFA